MKIRAALLLLCALLLPPLSHAADYAQTIAASRAYIANQMAQHHIPGCTIVLVESQRVVWAEAFGFADKEKQIPATTNTVMMIGSVSKMLTALMALQIQDEGGFDLDDPVASVVTNFAMLPRFANQTNAWTFRSMLNHHAGLPGDIYNGAFGVGAYWPDYTRWLVDYFHNDYPLLPPNLFANYGNSGFNLVGEAIGLHDGVDFTEAAETRLFAPLDMPGSSFLLSKPAVAAHLATGYSSDGSPVPVTIANMPATGGAFSRPLDMARIIQMLLADGLNGTNRLWSSQALAEFGAQSPGPLDFDNFFRPGLGLDTVADPLLSYAGRNWTKNGSTGKFEALFSVLPDQQLGAFVNINCANNLTFPILRHLLTNAVMEKSDLAPPPLPVLPTAPEANWTPEQLQAVAGFYATKDGIDQFVAEPNGTLTRIPNANAQSASLTNYVPHADGRFFLPENPGEQFAFTNVAGYDLVLRFGSDGGPRDEIIYGGYAETLHGTRLPKPDISPAWSNRCDTFWVANNLRYDDFLLADGNPSGVMLTLDNGFLSFQSNGGSGVLVPTNDSLAFVAGLSTRGDGAIRIETNSVGQERLWFGGYRCVRLEDIQPLTNQVVAAASASSHTNALFMHTGAIPGQRIALVLGANASDAIISVISLESSSVIARGTGTVEWVCDSDETLLSIGAPDGVDFELKAIDVTETRAAMQHTLAQFPDLPGIGVAAQEHGFLPIVLTEGLAAVNPDRPFVGGEQFHIASISKTYTAAAIFLLHQRGLLNISNTVDTYVPELGVPRASEITVEQLLEHRSGLPDANNTAWIDGRLVKNRFLEFTVEEIVAVARHLYPNLMFEPDTDHLYSDTGYNILARIVENVSGTNFQAFVQHNVLDPLGLSETIVPDNSDISVPDPALDAYMFIRGEFIDTSDWNPSVEFGCGSVITTLRDMLKTANGFFLSTNLLAAETHALMMEPLSATPITIFGRGCNWQPGLGWGHDGTMWGSLATLRADPSNGVCLATTANLQHEDERFLSVIFSLHGASALLKNALGYPTDNLGQSPPVLYNYMGAPRQDRDFRFQPLSFNFPTNWIIAGLPPGLSYDPASGQITGSTAAMGTHSISVTAQNAYGEETQTMDLIVRTAYINTIAAVSNAIVAAMAEEGAVGVSIALVDDQEVVWAQGFGWEDREAGIPVTTNTVFHIGSVSKAFTAALALQYAERGLLDLDAPFTNYTPAVTWKERYPAARDITVEDLLTHHSGLPGDLFRAGFLTQPLGRGYLETTNELAQTYPVTEPGTLNNYCNVAFVLLEGTAEAAAAAEGDSRPFDQLANAKLFDILDMNSTSYKFDKPAISNHLAVPYCGGQRMPPEYVEIYGTGSLYSQPLDMAQFMKTFFTDAPLILRPETRALMLSDQSTNALFDTFTSIHTGLGWDTVADSRLAYAGPAVWKNGATLAYSAQLHFLPEKKLGVAIAVSSSSDIPMTVDGLALQHALFERDGLHWPTNAIVYPTDMQPIDQSVLDALAGIYVGSTGYDIVESHPGSLTYRANAHLGISANSNMTLRTNGWFMSDEKPGTMIAFTNAHGHDIVRFRQAAGADENLGILSERFTPPTLPAAWSNRLDQSWLARNVPVDSYMKQLGIVSSLHFRHSNGVLYAETAGVPPTRALDPVSDDLAFLPGLVNRGDSAVQIVDVDGIEHVLYAGYFFGPAPDEIPLADSVSGAIATERFAQWYEIQPANPPEPVGGIRDISYQLSLSGAPTNFLLRLYQADGVTPVAERMGNGPLDLVSGAAPLLLCIQPASSGAQTGSYQIDFSVPLLVREIAMGETNVSLVWQGPTGTTFSVEAATDLASTNAFAPLLENINGTNLLERQTIPIADSPPNHYFRILEQP